MDIKLKFYVLSIVLALTSCAKKIIPTEGYRQINSKNSEYFTNANKAVVKKIRLDSAYRNKLTLSDSILIFNDSIKSNYQSFSFVTKPGKDYKIKVTSQCNCLGFKKQMFVPKIVIGSLNDRATPFADSVYFDYKSGRLSINKEWKLKSNTANETGKYEFLVFSDNTKLSENVFKFIVVPAVFIPVNIKSTLIGDFIVKVEEF